MDLNRYVTTGNLTADPILKTLSGGTQVCELRIANNGLGRGDRGAVGFLDVTVYGGLSPLPGQGPADRY